MKIFLNPGHGIKNNNTLDPGAIGSKGLKEYIETAEICNLIANKFTTKTSDVEIKVYQDGDLEDIVNVSNSWNADFFISVHCNSFSNPSANGIETYALASGGQGEKLAKSIQNELINATGLINRGVKFANFYVLLKTKMPAVLTEIGFISNSKEEALMNDPSWDERVAEAIFKGICKAVGITAKEVSNMDEKIEIPTGKNITPLGEVGYIEILPERVIIHYDKYTYLSIGKNGIYAYAKDKSAVKLI